MLARSEEALRIIQEYARDLREIIKKLRRKLLMETWAAYCEPKASSNVVQIRKR